MRSDEPSKPSDSLSPSEIAALSELNLRRGGRLSAALNTKTAAFRLYLTVFTSLVLCYIVAHASGLLPSYLAFGWTGQFFDFQMHRVRFLMAATMLTCGYVWLILGRELVHLLVCFFALSFYFAVTGLARLEGAMGDAPNFIFLSFFVSFHSTCLLLLLLLVREEVRSDVFTGRAE